MPFRDHHALASFLLSLGVMRAVYKPLAENDNSKQQIYLGGDFSFLTEIPFGTIKKYPDLKEPNFKAPLDFWWIDDSGNHAPAPHAQLILYPRYPEVRLSGFMHDCPTAPRGAMDAIPAELRGEKNAKDGRVLVMGMTAEGRIYAYLGRKDSPISRSLLSGIASSGEAGGTLLGFILGVGARDSRAKLLDILADVRSRGWIRGCRMDRVGSIIPYNARNGGGYTLEAQFGIIPNGRADPDFMGWELKAFSGNRITLMTPEPDGGYYRTRGAAEFVSRYGHVRFDETWYFTGTHKVGERNRSTDLRLLIQGFDALAGKITDVNGGLVLVSANADEIAASWSFASLMNHWSRKHALACYVRYVQEVQGEFRAYKYDSPALLGEGTDFLLFLQALGSHRVIYDPGVKASPRSEGGFKVHARSQFRMNANGLSDLYFRFGEFDF